MLAAPDFKQLNIVKLTCWRLNVNSKKFLNKQKQK